MKNDKCTIAVNNFPRNLWAKYTAWVHSNKSTVRDHLEYLLLKVLRESGVEIARFELDELINRISNKSKGIK